MTMAHDLIIDPFPPMVDSEKRLATWYAQGHSDGLGDRLLMFDNTSAPSWEILRFRPTLARNLKFELALRDQVERLTSFHHPAFPAVRPIKELGHEDGLAVVSTYTSGVRLTDALKKPRSAAFAVRLIRHLVPALAALQQHAPGIAHGALDADRIIVTTEGRIMIREHMVGAALASLELSAARLWADFGLLASPTRTGSPALDVRSDVVQLGLIVLSVMAGRRIGPEDYPDKVESLLDEIAERSGRQALVIFQPLRYWLERALQLDEYMFDSASDANSALADLRDDPGRFDDYFASLGSTLRDVTESAGALEEDSERQGRRGPRLIPPRRGEVSEADDSPSLAVVGDMPADEGRVHAESVPAVQPRLARTIRWVMVAVALLAGVEAIFIGRLLSARAATPAAAPAAAAVVIESPQPGANVWVDDQPAGVTPLQLTVGPRMRSIRVLPDAGAAHADRGGPDNPGDTERKATSGKVENRPVAAMQTPTVSQRTGGFRLTSPVEVHVLDGDRVIGSSGEGPIVIAAGRRELDFVNATIGYRERKVVDVKPGQITSLSLTLRNGTLNINAVPWASVSIDGNPVGDTPLGNLAIAPGEHEILFRHPQLGERREKIIVRADGPTRVSVNLQRAR